MALSVTQIYNMALSQLGVDKQVNPNDGSKEWKICSTWYDATRREMLCQFPWDFARITVPLSQTANTPPMNWLFQYAIPSDCLRMLRLLVPHNDRPRNRERIPYESAAAINTDGSTSNIINCNCPFPVLEYVQDVQDLSRWGSDALIGLALSLAAKIGMALTVEPQLVKSVADAARGAIAQAAANSMSEGFEGPEPEREFISCRQAGFLHHHIPGASWYPNAPGFVVD